MKVEKSKRNFWLTTEIEVMLNLIKEVQTIQGCTATTHHTFVQIANRMKKRGYPNKSPTQIRRKWFQMKSAYLCFKRGNVERLLLIPERFRAQIAHFVEAEYKTGKFPGSATGSGSADSSLNENSSWSDVAPCPPTPPEIKPNIIKEQIKVVKASTPIAMEQPPKPKVCVPKQTTTQHHQINNSDDRFHNDDPKDSYYHQKFSKFLTRLKQTHKLVSKDFSTMQESLMVFEQDCQAVRDSNLMTFLKNNTLQF